MKRQTFHIFCEVYGVNLFVVNGLAQDEFYTLLKKRFGIKVSDYYGDEPCDRLAGGVLDFDVWPFHVLWLGKYTSTDKVETKAMRIPKLAHEVFHHVLRVCKAKQIPTYPSIDNLIMDEAAAYLMEFYMREILKKL